jgi:hypothetical protein
MLNEADAPEGRDSRGFFSLIAGHSIATTSIFFGTGRKWWLAVYGHHDSISRTKRC